MYPAEIRDGDIGPADRVTTCGRAGRATVPLVAMVLDADSPIVWSSTFTHARVGIGRSPGGSTVVVGLTFERRDRLQQVTAVR